MELRVLRYFLAVAQEENITRAAALLHLTQPTLSRQLMQLEKELGTKLFRRSQHRIVLTEAGKGSNLLVSDDGYDGAVIMLTGEFARVDFGGLGEQEIVELADKTEQEFLCRESELSGEVAIGAGETRSRTFLSRLMASFRQIHPLVRFRIYSATADDVKQRLECGLLDMGLLAEPVEVGRYAFWRMPEKDRWGVLVRKDAPLARLMGVTPADLAGGPLLLSGRERVQAELASWFGEYWNKLDVAATYNLILNAANMVENGVGVAIGFDLGNFSDNLKFLPLLPEVETGTVLAWKRDQIFSAAVSQFHEYIQNAV